MAIAHDYLTQRGGAERVVLSLAKAFPDAPIYTTLYDADGTYPEFRDLDVRTSWLNHVGPFRRDHRKALPFLAAASRSLRIETDLVVASSSGWAHGFGGGARRLVYCHAPARWLYQPEAYLGPDASLAVRLALAALSPALRRWDVSAARRAEAYLANSSVVVERIKATYGIDAQLLPPPVVSAMTQVEPEPLLGPEGSPLQDGFLLCVSRLLPYKNVDRVVQAFAARQHLRLVVVGAGPERDRLQAMAPDNVDLRSGLTDGQMRWLYERCRGLVAASHEDFGLTPLEAAAHGKPCAVLRAGGFLDTMTDDTAVFFDAPEPDQIAAALDALTARVWDADAIRRRAADFSEARFVERVRLAAGALLA